MTPKELLQTRFARLAAGDFAGLFATYHPEAPFLRQFPDRSSYVEFARQQLSSIRVHSWEDHGSRILEEHRREHLLVMQLEVDGQRQYFYELALLLRTEDGWRYHSAQKLSAEDCPGGPDVVDFALFDTISEKIRF